MFYLTQLIGLPIFATGDKRCGRLKDVMIEPAHDKNLVQRLVYRDAGKLWQISAHIDRLDADGVRLSSACSAQPFDATNGHLLLTRDVLDQQIIDMNGRKVVRVNDVDFDVVRSNGELGLRAVKVDVGIGGALRRLFQGLVPRTWLGQFSSRLHSRVIPWNMFDLVETDAARRVKLQITYDALEKLHPADVADIVEELAPAEREALITSLDNEVAAEVLGEVEPPIQRALLNAMDSEKAADIVEAMDPDEAADVLADLPPDRSDEILQDMEQPERQDVAELLEYAENTAGGRMNTDFISVPITATVADAVEALRRFEGAIETVSTVFLVDDERRLVAAVPLARIVLAGGNTPLAELWSEVVSVREREKDSEVTELFDKYNLLTLPVVDADQRLVGVITADDVIGLLRDRK